jgi:hypothetical protein
LPQALLPLVPDGATPVNNRISVVKEGQRWTYFCGVHPVFMHPEGDRASFLMFTAQLVCQGICKQADIIRAFGVSTNSVRRSVAKYEAQGVAGFFRPRKTRGATVLTAEVIAQAQVLLSQGSSRRQVAAQLNVRYDTLRKAINQGRLYEPTAETLAVANQEDRVASDQSDRSMTDAAAEMGVACTRPVERVLAALGMLPGAPTRFENCRDVSFGGVLCALPALVANGLFEHLHKVFPKLGGYYTTLHVIILLAYMALCRIKTAEQLQYESPGELGKLMGLDRVPEVRCLRRKLSQLSGGDAPDEWAGLLSKQWLEADPERTGTLYVDGHVRLYHGKQTKLPRRYVSRQRLCLRGTTDYWVNDALGLPFFAVERPIDHGLLEALKSDIVPRLLQDIPGQPTKEELDADPYRCRFVIVFDREGYSPAFFQEMWQTHRIACITYHKFPQENWPETEFVETQITLPRGEVVTLKMAERGSCVGDKKLGLWVREVRKLNASGHQTSLISTAYGQLAMADAAGLFSRWCQENFFRYMMEHYAMDLLSEYQTEEIPGTNRPVVNPRWRELDRRYRSLRTKLQRRQAEFAAHTLHPIADREDHEAVKRWEQQKSELREIVEQLEHEVEAVKTQRQATPHHLEWDQLEADDKFERLTPGRKRLLDTIKLIAYRAETAMVTIVRSALNREDDARSLIRDLFRSPADITPDAHTGELRIAIHSFANPRSNRAIQALLEEINAAELTYPGTRLKLRYTFPSGVDDEKPTT